MKKLSTLWFNGLYNGVRYPNTQGHPILAIISPFNPLSKKGTYLMATLIINFIRNKVKCFPARIKVI
jgi:hypothetical protein